MFKEIFIAEYGIDLRSHGISYEETYEYGKTQLMKQLRQAPYLTRLIPYIKYRMRVLTSFNVLWFVLIWRSRQMIPWFLNVIKQCLEFLHKKHKDKICPHSSCLCCPYWEDCRFEENIDDIMRATMNSYETGYKDGQRDKA